jgi:hypothetical protein
MMRKRIGRLLRWLWSLGPFLPWAAALTLGCQREDTQCVEVCTELASVCADTIKERPAVSTEEVVESCRMCMESYALCRRGCEVKP